ncbi:Dps family protein [Parvularcula dongshanensis]|uniref:Starvation-inducible DNA-binding protein n=1 Tax=Parvularcula dongshanensis TaxID=1173995 RepID=A0A840I1V9_9PROT|nr:DNA starvation/stationary phase protection protein [Parvularcula dongshanensis]MBB4658737.1 starvation-inducible DNA-binding protein [Parvularcula dongshanensis]
MTEAHTARSPELPVESGLSHDGREALCQKLADNLAGTYVLYHKTQTYHWNVTGPLFYSVHKLTDKQYKDLAKAIDAIAERIRALGFPAPAGLKNIYQSSAIDDPTGVPEAGAMLRELALDHQHLAGKMRDTVEKAEEIGDTFTADFVTERIGTHEEFAWMLNALAVGDDRGSAPGQASA